MTIQISKANFENLEQLTQLFDEYRQFYGKSSDLVAAKEFLKERIENEDSEIFAAKTNEDQLVGFVQLYPLFSSTRMKRMWLLNDLYVRSTYRGKGISVKLIDRAKELAIETNACGLSLETEKTNTIGNNLYPKTGFRLDKENNYYFWTNQ